MTTTTRTKKIEDLRVKLAQLEAAEKAAAARVRAAASKTARGEDTRRKILIGAFMLERLALADVAGLKIGGVSFSHWLTRPSDLSLFGFQAPASHVPENQSQHREV
jgi:hypothetical protein